MLSRDLATEWCGHDAVPRHPEWGERYPERVVLMHARTNAFQRQVDAAYRIIDNAMRHEHVWRAAVSCGKDSTAMALLLAKRGAIMRMMSVKDDLDFPGEERFAYKLAVRCGMEIDIVRPPVSLQGFLRDEGISLVNDVHSRAAELSKTHFYGLLDTYRVTSGHDAVMLGLRAQESRGRKLNAATHGSLYTRAYDGLTVCQPLMNWSALDVHALLMCAGVPLLPVYGCLDEGMEWNGIRKSWWIAGGGAATYNSHYAWLRRWWPSQWDLAVAIDPQIARLS